MKPIIKLFLFVKKAIKFLFTFESISTAAGIFIVSMGVSILSFYSIMTASYHYDLMARILEQDNRDYAKKVSQEIRNDPHLVLVNGDNSQDFKKLQDIIEKDPSSLSKEKFIEGYKNSFYILILFGVIGMVGSVVYTVRTNGSFIKKI